MPLIYKVYIFHFALTENIIRPDLKRNNYNNGGFNIVVDGNEHIIRCCEWGCVAADWSECPC